jgi:acyl-CoA reductase-like NAD-dependent aldehyde dehydrogenase
MAIVTFGMNVAPALATGNSVIVKVSEFNPINDANLENALQNVLTFLTFNGQRCVIETRVYVQETKANECFEKLTQ